MSKINDQIKKAEDEKTALIATLGTSGCSPNIWQEGYPVPNYQGLTKGVCKNMYNAITVKNDEIKALKKKKRNTIIGIVAGSAVLLVVIYYVLKATNVIK